MSRIKDLQNQVHSVLENIEDEDKRLKAVSHPHGVAMAAADMSADHARRDLEHGRPKR